MKSAFTFTILVSILLLVSIYLIIKFLINFKNSIKKTKEVLGKELFIPYVQGFNKKSSSFYNVLLIDTLIISTLIASIVLFVRKFTKNNTLDQYSSFYLISIIICGILLVFFNISILVIKKVMFNEPQYKTKDNKILEELRSLKENVGISLTDFCPEKINIDSEKMEKNRVLATNTLLKFSDFYNNMDNIVLKKQYQEYLSEIFKINLFYSSLDDIQKGSTLDNLDYYAKIENNDNDPKMKIQNEIKWMESIDRKVEIIRESNGIESNIGTKEYGKKYDEYLETIRSQDPNYALIQKNTWLTYRDYEFEDLFYNPHAKVSYSLDGKTDEVFEKPLDEFLEEYKKYLIIKFYKNK